MIRLSTKGRYGARLMLELAASHHKQPLQLKAIAKKQEISEGYLEHIVMSLKSAGLVNSGRRGHGGYTLAKPPAEITLGDVVRAVEGDVAIVECVSAPRLCHRAKHCVTRDIWSEVSEKVSGVSDNVTLEKMVERQYHKENPTVVTYQI